MEAQNLEVDQKVEVIEKIVAHWTRRLNVKHMSKSDDDARSALTAAIAAIVDDADEAALRDAGPEVTLGFAVTAGIEIAVAVMDNPLGDVRPAILQALEVLAYEIRRDAEASRSDAARVAQTIGDSALHASRSGVS